MTTWGFWANAPHECPRQSTQLALRSVSCSAISWSTGASACKEVTLIRKTRYDMKYIPNTKLSRKITPEKLIRKMNWTLKKEIVHTVNGNCGRLTKCHLTVTYSCPTQCNCATYLARSRILSISSEFLQNELDSGCEEILKALRDHNSDGILRVLRFASMLPGAADLDCPLTQNLSFGWKWTAFWLVKIIY